MQEQLQENQMSLDRRSHFDPMNSGDLRNIGLESVDHRNQIADLKKQVDDLTKSIHGLQQSLDTEKKQKSELISTHNIKMSEVINQLEELKSSRTEEATFKMRSGHIKTDFDLQRTTREFEEELKKEKEAFIGLERKYIDLGRQLQETESEKRKYAEEVEILTQRLELQGKTADEFQNESLISRLNSRISALKYKEQKLYEENAKLEGLYNELRR